MASNSLGLTPSQLSTFRENGYLVIPDYFSSSEISNLLSTTHTLLSDFDLSSHPLTRFTTGDDPSSSSQHVGDTYFLDSGDKVRFFFEPDAFSSTDPSTLTRPKHLSINKIGHSLHTLSPPFAASTISPRNAAIAASLGFRDPRVLQSMIICKQPGIGAAVPPHKDSEFLYTDPPSAVGWWFALQDAGAGNASLGFWKGSHKRGYVKRRFVRKNAEIGTEFVEWNGNGLARDVSNEDGAETEKDNSNVYTPRDEDYELLDIKAGSLVLIHGNVLHKSEKNEGANSRYAYTFHVIEGGDGYVYDKRNWLQPPDSGEFTKLFTEKTI